VNDGDGVDSEVKDGTVLVADRKPKAEVADDVEEEGKIVDVKELSCWYCEACDVDDGERNELGKDSC